MKKIKWDPKKAQEFFISHVEKVVFGLVVIAFIWFAQYTLLNRKGFPQTPEELIQIVRSAEQRIKKPPEKLPVEAKDYEQMIKKTMGTVDRKAYAHQVLWCPPVFDPPPKRGEPRLLTVRELRAAAGCAKVYATASASGWGPGAEEMPGAEGAVPASPVAGMARETTRGERWVVLTGLVPYREQIEAYQEAFQAARRAMLAGSQPGSSTTSLPGAVVAPQPTLLEGAPGAMPATGPTAATNPDMPIYVHYHVQRVEVQSPSDPIDETDWQAGAINVRRAKEDALRRWGSHATPLSTQQADYGVSPIFLEPALDFPLPRFADGRELDETFAHPPEIPLMQKQRWQIGPDGRPVPVGPSPEVGPPSTQPVVEKPAPYPKDLPDFPAQPGMAPGIGPGGIQPGGGEMPPGALPGLQPAMEPYGPVGGPRSGSFYGTIRLPDYKLFRFVDRTVEPGKRYRYRVRLWLWNPNYKQDPRFLERPELGKEPYIATAWSDPSNVVEVPRDDRLLVLGVKPPSTYYEANGKVVLLKWLHEEGELATKEQEKVLRGQVLNLRKQKWPEEAAQRTSPTTPARPSAKVPGETLLMEDYQMLLNPRASKSRKTSTSKEKEKPPVGPEWIPGMGMGLPPAAPQEIDYMTECLVVDLRGGYRIDLRSQLPGQTSRSAHSDPNYNAPGEILLWHPDGYLYVQNELEDSAEYEKILQLRAPKYDERFGPGWMGVPPGMLEEGPPPPGVPGELFPGELPRSKSSRTAPKRQTTPRPTRPPGR